MKKLFFLLLIPVIIQAQTKPIRTSLTRVGTATTAVVTIKLPGGDKDLTIINTDPTTETDTLIIFKAANDTLNARWQYRTLLLPNWRDYEQRFSGDTLYLRSSNSSPYYIKADVR